MEYELFIFAIYNLFATPVRLFRWLRDVKHPYPPDVPFNPFIAILTGVNAFTVFLYYIMFTGF